MPIPFRAPDTIPIIGQTFTLKGGYSTLLVQCNCPAKEPIILIGNNPNACPVCHRVFAAKSVTITPDGQVRADIGLMVAVPDNTSENHES